MTIFEILSLSRELLKTDIETLSDKALISHVRALTSIMFFVSSGVIGEETDRKALSYHLLKKVYPALLNRYSQSISITEKYNIIDARLQTLYYGISVSDSRQNRCYKDIDNILSALSTEELYNLQGKELTSTLQLIVHSLYSFDFDLSHDEEPDDYELFLKTTISSWANSLNDDGSWDNISEEAALGRLRVMDMNSYMLLDKTYESELQRAFAFYCRIPDFDVAERITPDDVSLLVMMYDTLDLSGQMQRQKADAVLQKIVRLLDTRCDLPEANAIVVAYSCRIVGMEVDKQLTENFAVRILLNERHHKL